jgi:hypothetical protein
MLTSDLSRFLVQPHKQYSGVRLQQGRVFTDADHNEQAFLQENELRLATLDLLGPRASTDNGFILGALPSGTTTVVPFSPDQTLATRSVTLNGETFTAHAIWLGAGSLYVSGRRFELLEPEAFVFQRDFLQMKRGDVPSTDYVGTGPNETDVSFAHLYLLHTWEQEISAVEDPEILEPALGNVDTSTRIRRMRRVEAFTELPGTLTSIDGAYARFMAKERENNADIQRATGERLSRGRLQLTFVEERATLGRCDECNPMPARRLLGAQNATLRILLTSPDRYVWAYDNSAPLYRILLRGRSTLASSDKTTWSLRVEMLSPPIDETAWPMPGRVVELLPIGSIIEGPLPDEITSPHYKKLAERIGCFLRVSQGYTPQSRGFELEATDDGGEIAAQLELLRSFVTTFSSEHPEAERLNYVDEDGDAIVLYCRLWHDASQQSSPTIPIEAGAHGAPLGDTGIVPVFHRLGRRGDFWIAALRPEQPRPIVPFDLSEKDGGVPPHGPKDFFVPLALVTGNGATLGFNADARQGIGRSVDTGCVTFTVGDGINSQGDFRSIQEAIEALPAEGGHILVRRGTYRERLHLQIDNVVLEACGEHVVIETPPPESPPLPEDPDRSLIDIDGCSGIRIGGFRVHAVEERAIWAHGSSTSDLVLAGLTCRAGQRKGWAFVPGTQRPSELPLVELDAIASAALSGLVLEPSSRQGLRIYGTRATVTGLTAISEASSDVAPTEPLVSIEDARDVLVEDSALTAHGRVGLAVSGSSEITLRQLSVTVSRHRAGRNKITQSRSGIELLDVTASRLLSSWITMDETPSDHATIFVHGTALTIAKNHFEVLARCFESPSPSPPSPDTCRDLRVQAYGGVQLAGGCRDVELRENQILGGVGHGITLGSVYFEETESRGEDEEGNPLPLVTYRYGAGFGQIARRRDGHLGVNGKPRLQLSGRYQSEIVAKDDGALVDVRILENRIEQMNGNGISVITVLGFPDGDSLIDVLGLRIAGNTIVDNLRHPAENIPLAENFGIVSDSVAGGAQSAGAFSQSSARQADTVHVLPLGAIVLGAVTLGDITGNVIVGNGHSETLPINGIFVLLGEAIRIANNRIASNGGRARIDSPSYSPPPGPAPGIRAGIAVLLAGTGSSSTPVGDELANENSEENKDAEEYTFGKLLTALGERGVNLDDGGSSLRILGNTVRHPEGRALHVVATGPVAIVGNFFSSEGNHGADTVSDAYQVGDVVYVQNLGAPWEANLEQPAGSTILVNRTAPPNAESYLDFRNADDARAVFGEGGAVQFKDNQITFDWEVLRVPHLRGRRPPLGLFPVAIVSLDHVTLDGNQFAFRLRGRKVRTAPPRTSPALIGYVEPVFGHVLAVGGTVQASNNRIAESVGSTILSLVAIGQLSCAVTYNQCTHEVLAISDAYDELAQLGALQSRYQSSGTDVHTFVQGTTAISGMRLLNPHTVQNYLQVGLRVTRGGNTTSTVAAELPEFELTLLVPDGSDTDTLPDVSQSERFVSTGGIVTLPKTGVMLQIPPGSYAGETTYQLQPMMRLAAEGTEPPAVSLVPFVGTTLQVPPVNAEFELRITARGTITADGSGTRPRFRYRLRGGEAWSVEQDLNASTAIALPRGTSSIPFATLSCATGTYGTDNVYRMTAYQPLSSVLLRPDSTTTTPPTISLDSKLNAPTGAYRVLVKVLQSGVIDSANANVPECRYSLNGGLSWSRVMPVKARTVLGTTGVSLNFGALWQTLTAADYFEFETYLPPLSRDLSWPWLTRLGNQVLFRPQGTALNLTATERLVRFSKRFVVLLSKVAT